MDTNTQLLLLMGVSGSGKSTIGELLARELNWQYADADSFHSPANIAKMSAGHPLTDEDREPWLRSIRAWIDERIAKAEPGVVTCSALKRRYRDVLRAPGVRIVYLRGARDLLAQRLGARKGHYFKLEMLDSQLAALEEPAPGEHAITVSIANSPDAIAEEIITAAGVQR